MDNDEILPDSVTRMMDFSSFNQEQCNISFVSLKFEEKGRVEKTYPKYDLNNIKNGWNNQSE